MGDGITHEVFLIDTQLGKVWLFQPGGIEKKQDGSEFVIPKQFLPIDIFEWDAALGKYVKTSEKPTPPTK